MEKRVTISWCGFQIGDAMRVGKSGEKSKKTERGLRVVYQYRRGLRNVIAGIKSVISNCSNGCPSGWKDGTHETSFASQVGLEMGRTVLTLSEERVPGHGLLKIISPGREVSVGVCFLVSKKGV